MRKLLLLLPFLFLWPTTSHAQIVYASHNCGAQNGGQGTTRACTIDNTSGVGHINIFTVLWCHDSGCDVDPSADTFSIADGNGSATCIAATRVNGTTANRKVATAICYRNSIASNASNAVTLTLGGNWWYATIIASEYSGQATSNVVDQTTTFYGSAGPTASINTPATLFTNELVYGSVWNGGCCIFTVGSGYTNTGIGSMTHGVQSKSFTSTGVHAFDWNETGTNANAVSLATFVAATQPSTFVPQVGGFLVGP